MAENGQLTRAAERLHLSQPALSAQIKALEDELSVVLFERGASGMTLTAAGKRLLPEARRVLAAAQSLRSAAMALHGEATGRISMGTVGDPDLTRIGRVLRDAVERYPLVEIDVRHEISGAAFNKVRDGELDAAFYYGDLSHTDVATLTLGPVVFRIVAPAAMAARLAPDDWQGLAAEPWIITPPLSTHHALARQLFEAHEMKPVRHVEADHEAVISSLVSAGLGVALMREEVALAEAAKGALAIVGEARLTTELSFIYRRDRDHDPAIRAIRDVVQQVFDAETDVETRTESETVDIEDVAA